MKFVVFLRYRSCFADSRRKMFHRTPFTSFKWMKELRHRGDPE
jgi:hypothetical protein